jgi:TetR/AcrR family transcriptional regulator, regulator of mycofactocin system
MESALVSGQEVPGSVLEPPSRRDRRTARTRQAIIDAAHRLFEDRGFTETTIDQIAEAADVAPRTFFRHFASKEAVLFADFEEYRRRMIELISARPRDEHPIRSVVLGMADYCDIIAQDRERLAWSFRISQQCGVNYEQTMMKAQTFARIAAFIAERLGVEEESDPRPHAWATVIMTQFGLAVKRAILPGGSGRPREEFLALVDQTAAGMVEAARRS